MDDLPHFSDWPRSEGSDGPGPVDPGEVRAAPLDVPDLGLMTTTDFAAAPAADFAAVPLKAPKTKRRGMWTAALATTAVVVAGVTVGLVAGSGSGSGSVARSATPSAIVLLSAQTALADRTADLGISMSIHTSTGASISATGSGAVDFTTDAGQMNVTYAGASQMSGEQLSELFVGRSFYLSTPGISTIAPGKFWVSETLAGASSMTPGSSNPASMLQLLGHEGASVRPAGSTAIGGTAVRAYDVEISPASIARRIASAGLPSSVLQEVKTMFGSSGVHVTVYVSDATNLIRRITTSMAMSFGGVDITGAVTEDLTNYGVPVSITAPPASQVISLRQFEAAAVSQGSQSSTA